MCRNRGFNKQQHCQRDVGPFTTTRTLWDVPTSDCQSATYQPRGGGGLLCMKHVDTYELLMS